MKDYRPKGPIRDDFEVVHERWGDQDATFRPGRLVAVLPPSPGLRGWAQRLRQLRREQGLRRLDGPDRSGVTLLEYDDRDRPMQEVVEAIMASGLVEAAEPNLVDYAQSPPYWFDTQWGVPFVEADTAWMVPALGSAEDTLIGVIDTGIPLDRYGALLHPDLSDTNRIILGTNYMVTPNDKKPDDGEGHGTHITGIIAADHGNNDWFKGMDDRSKVYICKTEVGTKFDTYAFYKACKEISHYAVRSKRNFVINYSAGGLPWRYRMKAMRPVFRDLGASFVRFLAASVVTHRGGLLCAAVGNYDANEIYSPEVPGTKLSETDTGKVLEPASLSYHMNAVIGVGAVNGDSSHWEFSRTGRAVTVVAPGGTKMTAPAPGLTINSTWPDDTEDRFSGTSQATAYVTGAAALIWSANPAWDNIRVRRQLTGTALKPAGASTYEFGSGIIRVATAVGVPVVAGTGTP